MIRNQYTLLYNVLSKTPKGKKDALKGTAPQSKHYKPSLLVLLWYIQDMCNKGSWSFGIALYTISEIMVLVASVSIVITIFTPQLNLLNKSLHCIWFVLYCRHRRAGNLSVLLVYFIINCHKLGLVEGHLTHVSMELSLWSICSLVGALREIC